MVRAQLLWNRRTVLLGQSQAFSIKLRLVATALLHRKCFRHVEAEVHTRSLSCNCKTAQLLHGVFVRFLFKNAIFYNWGDLSIESRICINHLDLGGEPHTYTAVVFLNNLNNAINCFAWRLSESAKSICTNVIGERENQADDRNIVAASLERG